MPEGHTLHRLAGDLTARFAGLATRSSSPQGRFAQEAALIDGRIMDGAQAYGKHLFCTFGDLVVHVHLGLLGKVQLIDGPPPAPVGAVRWRLTTLRPPLVAADLRGAIVCELITEHAIDAIVGGLGPDPLRPDADPDVAWARISRSRAPIAALLMDQRIAAGVGNIYRAELLFRHRLDPLMAGNLLRANEWRAMWVDLVVLMSNGVRTGRIDTVRPQDDPEVTGRAPRIDRHGGEVYVYRRAGLPCLVCGHRVRMAQLAGRNLFWCPGCQRRSRRTQRGR